MKFPKYCKQLCSVFALMVAVPTIGMASPDLNPDPNADVIYVRTNCSVANTDPGESPIENCFESTGKAMGFAGTRVDVTKPLLIDFGPGIFKPVTCPTDGTNISFRGAGTDKTIIGGVFHAACLNTKWSFHDLTIKGVQNAVFWLGGGQSEWHNVILEGEVTGWADTGTAGGNCEVGEQPGTHRFFSSRIISHGANGEYGFGNACGDNWLWGSEILMITANSNMTLIKSHGAGSRMHIYGSNIRAELASNAGSPGTLTAIKVFNGAELHSHGNGIDVVAKPGWKAVALHAESLGEIHADGSAYFFGTSTAGINVSRIVNNGGHVHAPYQWAGHTSVPNITSIDGADTSIVTTAGSTPRFMIYSTTCASKWFDVGANTCKP